MRSVRLFLASRLGSFFFRSGINGFWILALLFCCQLSARAQGKGTNGGAFSFATNRVVVSEKDGIAYLTVTRTSEVGKMLVDIIEKDGTATNQVDFKTPGTNTVVFNNLQTAVAVTIPITDNTKTNAAGSANASFTLANPRPAPDEDPAIGGTLGNTKTAQLIINDEDRELEFNIEKTWYQVAEPQPTNVFTLMVNVILAKPPTDKSSEVSVDYQVTVDKNVYPKPGSDYATSGQDFEEVASGNLAFGPNDTSLPIAININSDTLLEFNEDFHIILTQAHGKLSVDTTNAAPAGAGTTGGGFPLRAFSTTAGSTAGTTAGTTAGGTDSGGGTTTVEYDYKLGKIPEATVTILFNGKKPQELTSGSLDLSFNQDSSPGTTPPNNPNPGANGEVLSVARDAKGNIVLGGIFNAVNAVSQNRIARLTPDGQLDPTFQSIGGANDFVSAVEVYTNGVRSGQVLLAGGFTSVNGVQRNGIARLNNNGTIDTSFNPGTGADGPVYAIALQKDGTVLVGGDFSQINGIPRNGIARLADDGSVDLSFNPGTGADGPVFAIASLSAAPIVVTNRAPVGDPSLFFQDIPVGASSGFLTLTYNFFSASNNILVLAGTNILYNSGLTNNEQLVTNVVDGSISTNIVPSVVGLPFQGSTIRIVINTMTNQNTNWVFSAVIQPDTVLGSVIGGDFNNYDGVEHGRIAKLGTNGVSDLQFNQATGLGADATVRALTVQKGRVILGGAFTSFNSFASKGIAALATDGSFDRTFALGRGAEDGDVLALRTLPDGKILVGGNFTYFNQTRRTFLTRLLTNGPVDTSFLDPSYNQYAGFSDKTGLWPIGAVNTFTVDPTNNVIVAGSFSLVGGGEKSREEVHPRINIARLNGGETRGPGNLELALPSFGADENSGILPVTLNRKNGSLGAGTVLMSTTDGAAISTNDFVGVTNTVVSWGVQGPMISDGATNNQLKSIVVNDDTLVEGDENFSITLNRPQSNLILGGYYIPAGFALGEIQSGKGIIIDNDSVPAVVSFTDSQFDVNENDGRATITVIRTGSASTAVSVRYTAGHDNGANPATDNVDYTPTSGTLSFAAGQTNKTFTVSIRDDQDVEQDESVKLTLANPSSGIVLGTNATATLNIIDNDYAPGRVNLTTTNYSVTEGQSAQITVRRTGGNTGVLRVNYSTVDGSATVPGDYTETTGTLQWNDRDSAPQVITIPITDDGLAEGPRQFSIRLFGALPEGALGIRTNATINIIDNDSLGAFAFNAAEYLADENGTNAIINVVRRGGSAETAIVNFSTLNLTNLAAIAGVDYQATNGSLTFLPGETSKSFAVPILDNTKVDSERRIGLVLSNAQPVGASLGTLSNAFITIVDNETLNIPAGGVQTDFGTGAGANDAVQALALQSDGKILIGGDFTFVNRQLRTHLARLNSDSSLDTSFGVDYDINDSVRALAVQSDGRILLAGAFTEINSFPLHYLARLSSGGTLDNTFDIGSGADNPIFAVAETTVGTEKRILIGGAFSTFNGIARRGIARVNGDGRTDLSFNPGSGINGTVYALTLQRDGKILVGGEFSSVNGVSRVNIARLNADGSLDTTFDAGLGADGSVRSIAVQFDDRVLIGGLFTSVSGVSYRHVARLNPDGTLDSTFKIGTGADGAVYAIALQLDGNILLGGDFTSFNGVPENRIVRLSPNGSIDPSINFGTGANAFIGALAIQPDRRILAGGGFTVFDGLPRNRVARLYGGSLKGAGDIEFAQPNFTVNEAGTNVTIFVRRTGGLLGTVAINYASRQSSATSSASPGVDYTDVSGTLVFGPGENTKSFVVPVINDNLAEPNELVDLILSNPTGGAALGNQPVATLTIVSDDSVISFSDLNYFVNESAPGGRAVITIIREGDNSSAVSVVFTASSGTALDGADFTGVTTNVVIAAGQSSTVVTVPIIDDTIVEDSETIALRLSSPGTGGLLGRPSATLTILDNDFAPGILTILPPTPTSESAAGVGITVVRNSGKTGAISVQYNTADGTATGQGANADYTRVSGTLSFLEGETTKSFFVPFHDDNRVEGNETFTVNLFNPTGGARIDTNNVPVQVLILDDDFGPGSLDTSFNTSGGAGGTVSEILIQPDGKIVAVGAFSSFGGQFANNVVRLNSNGSIDNSFSTGNGTDGSAFTVARSFDGKISIGGAFTNIGGISRRFVGKVLTNGFVDTDFSKSAGENARALALAAQSDGKVLVGGDFTTPAAHILRLNTDGSLDVSFNPDTGTDGPVNDIAVLSSGRILIGGSFTNVGNTASRGLARLLPNGLLDSSFKIGTGVAGAVNSIFVSADNTIMIAGNFTGVNGAGRSRVARLNADGSVDQSFNPAAINGTINDVIVYRGKVYVAGSFTTVGNVPRKNLARLNPDGSLDESFDPGIGPDAAVNSLVAQSTGQIIIAGNFQTVNGFSTPGIARLNAETVLPSQDIVLTVIHATNGFLLFTFTSEIGQSYVIEGSTDLKSWQAVDTKVATSTTTDYSTPTNGPFKFFRVRPSL